MANIEIMLRLSLINLYSPMNSQGDIPKDGLSKDDYDQIRTWSIEWIDYITSRAYRTDAKKLGRVYQFVKGELERCDLYMLHLIPGTDFFLDEISEEKLTLPTNYGYTNEVYGAGTLTNLETTTVDTRDMSTPLGKDFVATPENIRRCVGLNGDNAYCLIRYFYPRYLHGCKSASRKPIEVPLLRDFINKT